MNRISQKPAGPAEEPRRPHFDERDSDGPFCQVGFHLVAQVADELVRDDENDDLRPSDGLHDVWDGDLAATE